MNKKINLQSEQTGELFVDGKSKIIDFAKSKVFDIIGLGLIGSMVALILDTLKLREISFDSFISILVDFIPFYVAALALTINYYTKGSFSGKGTKIFLDVVNEYSKLVSSLTGSQIELLPYFCLDYNEKALTSLQDDLLKRVAITHNRFNTVTLDLDGNKLEPLKSLTNKEIKKLYNKETSRIIIKAKKAKVKGIHANILLGNSQIKDITNLGKSEKQLGRAKTIKYAIGYLVTILFLTLITVKNFLEWGWASLLYLSFKIIYVVCRAYLRYFDGYRDVTISLSNHITRKSDILKSYNSWYCEHCNEYNIKLLQYPQGENNETSNTCSAI